MRRSLLLVVAPYVLIVAVAFVGFRQLESQANAECSGRRDGREVLRELVIQSFTPGQSIDLTKIPGFADLDDASKVYFSNLSAALNAGAPSDRESLRDRLLTLIPPIDC